MKTHAPGARPDFPYAFQDRQSGPIIVGLVYGDEGNKATVKKLGARWNGVRKTWEIPWSLSAFDYLAKTCPSMSFCEDLVAAAEAERQAQIERRNQAAAEALEAELRTVALQANDADVSVPGLRGDLFPFQGKGVRWADMCQGRAYIADEMGLGKTVQALAYLQLHPEARPALVFCPAALRGNWAEEAARWLGEGPENAVTVIRAGKDQPGPAITICNYDLAHTLPENYAPAAVVLDEAQYIKEPDTRRTKAVERVSGRARHVIALSGTPILNRPRELFTALHLLRPDVWEDRRDFETRYCGGHVEAIGKKRVWRADGATHTDELREALHHHVMIRRLKQDVLADLPAKTRQVIPVALDDLDNAAEYRRAQDDFADWLLHHKISRAQALDPNAERPAEIEDEVWRALRSQALVKHGKLWELVGIGKVGATLEWAQGFLTENDAEKLVLFAYHQDVQDALFVGLTKYGVVRFAPGADYLAAKRRFQEDPAARVAVCSLKAAGPGLTLTAASTMVLAELDWTPALLDQAEDRIHRIGQEDACHYVYPLCHGSVDDDIWEALDRKRLVTRAILKDDDQGKVARADLITKVRAAIHRMGLTPVDLLTDDDLAAIRAMSAAGQQEAVQADSGAGAAEGESPEGDWLTVSAAVAYMRERGVPAQRANVLMDLTGRIARGHRLAPWYVEGVDARKVANSLVAGGYHWVLRRDAVDRRIAGRGKRRSVS